MPMPPYAITCGEPGCWRPALYKVAARWSDGVTSELKTYALCCGDCLPQAFRRACFRQAACRLARNETLEMPGIYRLARGRRDAELERLSDLETRYRPPAGDNADAQATTRPATAGD